ncbi:hypothetical protein [Biformimicrobium ophioploci]|nr:hypothetical protein [Microbulbifer sp. NKW57]
MIKRTCPECRGSLVLLISIGRKVCADCHKEFKWDLDKDQKPLFGPRACVHPPREHEQN